MEARIVQVTRVFGRLALATAALSGFLLFAGAANAQPRDSSKCQRRIDRAEWKLEEAIQRHGFYSRQANHRRNDLRQERERCWRESERWRHNNQNRHRDRNGDWDRD